MRIILVGLLVAWALTGSARGQLDRPGLSLRRGLHEASGTPVRYGTMRVWEDRAAQRGRLISLEVVVLEATGDEPAPDPVFVFAGGPGQNAASMSNAWATHWIRDRRDIVLVSQRGTGGDNRLWCELPGGDDDLQAYLEPMFIEESFRDCLAALSQKYDLTRYGTADAVDDIDDIRKALGYERINLYGGSYGSRAELEFIRRHPESVRTAILNSVAPVSFINPLYHAWGAQHALDLIMDDCASDPACADAYGDLHASFDAIMAALDEGPVAAEVVHPTTGQRVRVELSKESFGEALRVIMYYDRSQVPYLIDRAAGGDYAPFAQTGINAVRSIRQTLALGMLLCVTCAEDVDRITEEMILAETAETFLGDGRVRRQRAVCAFWPRSALPGDAADPVTGDVPVLLLSGRYDPVTPPRWAAQAAGHLPEGLHVVGPGAHGQHGACIDAIIRQVLERGTTRGVDVGCVEQLEPTPFRLPR